MKELAKRHKGKIATALTLGAGAAATYYLGPQGGELVREYAPSILGALGRLFGL